MTIDSARCILGSKTGWPEKTLSISSQFPVRFSKAVCYTFPWRIAGFPPVLAKATIYGGLKYEQFFKGEREN
jgi:hypothetical protein